uniref:Interferon regulatory factor 7 n=1 Tax=Takifugu rubripes TaxID=31033 RepID=H2TVX6_TAKRU
MLQHATFLVVPLRGHYSYVLLRPFAGTLSVIVTSKQLLWKQTENFYFNFHVFDWQAWAVASGKINDFPNDKARWKTNFRSALYNLSERFKMVQDNSKNSDDPHKIYQIINTGCKYENLPTQSSQEDSDMDIYSPPVKHFTLQSELNLHNDFTALDLGDQPAEEQPWAENYTIQYCPADLGGYPAAAEIHPQPMADKPSQYEVNLPQAILSPVQPDIYDLEISIHYRKREMLRTTVKAPRVQLHYHSEAPELKAHHHICFPPTEGLLDRKQIEYTNRVLNSIQKGLLLEVRDTGIYATRQDRCHVFASTSDPSVAHPEPSKLPQNNIVELLSFAKYAHELKLFKENNGGSPEYTINMCFGEKFPDGKALEKKLVSVKVVPLICQHLHEMAHLEGASSLHSSSISLQMSHNSLFDLINSVFGLPMADQELA